MKRIFIITAIIAASLGLVACDKTTTRTIGASLTKSYFPQLKTEPEALYLTKVIGIESADGIFHWVITSEGHFLLPLSLQTDYINAGFVSVSKKEGFFCVHIIPPYCSAMGKVDKL